MNQYETQAIAEDFERLGFVLRDFNEKCDVYVINTCTVTAESDKKSRQMISKARKTGGSDALIVVAGCYSQAQIDKGSSFTHCDIVFGNGNKSEIATFVYNYIKEKSCNNNVTNMLNTIESYDSYDNMNITHSERTRAVVKIADGCENKCSYCIIPSVRGKIRSKHPDDVISELKTLADAGYKEVVLTGIETAAYGKDLDDVTLPMLLEKADQIPGIQRIRLGSLEPTVIKQDFVKTVANSRHIVPHFHLSLQSGSDSVLRNMRRKYNTKMFYDCVSMLKENIKNLTITTDIIVGFPGETDEMFNETCEFVKKCGFLYVHIFPYSRREGTDAANYPEQISSQIKKNRASILKSIMNETRKEVLKSFDGAHMDVLFEEKTKDGLWVGHTANFIEAKLYGCPDNDIVGEIHNCKIIYSPENTEHMICELI